MRRIFQLSAIVTLILAVAACGTGSGSVLREGDLLFQRSSASPYSDAIEASTGSFVHVGIFTHVNGHPVVVEAVPRLGVTATPLDSFLREAPVTAKRLRGVDIDLKAATRRARALLGSPYDPAFDPRDFAFYCSELVQVCYLLPDGEPLFPSSPMNFRDANGDMPPYWTEVFSGMGRAIPEGEPGTNPTGIATHPSLRVIFSTHK